jgi:flagellar basal body-associated protein FliL
MIDRIFGERGAAKMPLALVLGIVLAAGGAFVGMRMGSSSGGPPPEPKYNHYTYGLGSFVINLDPADGFRYLKITVALDLKSVMSEEDIKKKSEKHKFEWSDAVVQHLSGRSFSELRTGDGRGKMTARLVALLNGHDAGADGPAVKDGKNAKPAHKPELIVDKVYFAEFVAQ